MKKAIFTMFLLALCLPVFSQITVTSPAGNQDYCMNKRMTVRWTSTGQVPNQVDILLRRVGGGRTLLTENPVPNDGYQSVVIPYVEPGQYFIRVRAGSITGDSPRFTLSRRCDPYMQDFVIRDLKVTSSVAQFDTAHALEFSATLVNVGADATRESQALLTLMNHLNHIVEKTYTFRVPGLNRNQTHRLTHSCKIRKAALIRYVFKADSTNIFWELDENNNKQSKVTAVLQAPDLLVHAHYRDRVPLTLPRTVSITVKNVGEKGSLPCKLRFYVQHHGEKFYDVPVIEPNQTHRISRTERWYTIGVKRYNARVDTTNLIPEYDETNNNYSDAFCYVGTLTTFDGSPYYPAKLFISFKKPKKAIVNTDTFIRVSVKNVKDNITSQGRMTGQKRLVFRPEGLGQQTFTIPPLLGREIHDIRVKVRWTTPGTKRFEAYIDQETTASGTIIVE